MSTYCVSGSQTAGGLDDEDLNTSAKKGSKEDQGKQSGKAAPPATIGQNNAQTPESRNPPEDSSKRPGKASSNSASGKVSIAYGCYCSIKRLNAMQGLKTL